MDTLFPNSETRKPKQSKTKKSTSECNDGVMVVSDILTQYKESCAASNEAASCDTSNVSTRNVFLEVENEKVQKDLEKRKLLEQYQRGIYSVMGVKDEVLCMETGLPDKQIFSIVVNYVRRLSAEIRYFYGWQVERILLEDQVFITLMKVWQNYTNLHLAELFHCSTATISNSILTFVHVLCKLLFEDCLTTVPSKRRIDPLCQNHFQFLSFFRNVLCRSNGFVDLMDLSI